MTGQDLSSVRRAASARGLAARWGAARPPSKTVRVDAEAADRLATVPERDRRRVASEAIRRAVAEYAQKMV